MSATLTIDLSEEYKIKIEEPKDLERSFFKDIYQLAAKAVDDIITQTEKNTTGTDKNDPFQNEKQDYNNIIAFCGERGTGKSSAMISFAQSLLKLNESKDFYTDKELITKNFHTIQVIDPSLFEEHENIFEVILAQLFSSFEKELNKKEKDSKLNAKRELLEQFEKVYENLQTIKKNGQKYDGEALETLNKLACGANLRQNFKELVKRYLDFIVGKEEKNNAYLIIPIDDFDLNVNAAAEMAEQIRKYLMIPHVIVLMAVKIEQLADAKEQQVRKDFNILLKASPRNNDPIEIASKYLSKLIPENRRLNLPLVVDIKVPLILKRADVYIFDENEVKYIQNSFLELCYTKYSILFAKPDYGIHPIIPNNLRDLKEWFIFLTKQKNSDKNRFSEFKDYFLSSFGKKRLMSEQYKLLRKLAETNIDQLNMTIIREVVSYIKDDKRSLFNEEMAIIGSDRDEYLNEFTNIMHRGNYPHNISLGDIKLFLDVILRYHKDKEVENLVFAIKTIITISLKEAIVSGNLNSLNSIIGTTFYNQKEKPLLLEDRSFFKINYNNITIAEKKIETLKILSEKETLTDEDFVYLQIFEWLHYFILGTDASENYRSKEKERIISKNIRIFDNVGVQKNVHFDILISFISVENYKNIRPFNCNDSSYLRNSMKTKIEEWKSKNTVSFPFESFDQIEYIFKTFRNDYKEKKERNLSGYFNHSLGELKRRIKSFERLHSYYDSNLAISYFTNPVYDVFSKGGDIRFINFINKDLEPLRKLLSKHIHSLYDYLENEKIKLKGSISSKKGSTLQNQLRNIYGAKGLAQYAKDNPKVGSLIDKIKDYRTTQIDKSKEYSEEEVRTVFLSIDEIIKQWETTNSNG